MRESNYEGKPSNGDQKASNLVLLGQLIARKRREHDLSVADLAKLVEVTPADIQALESGAWDVDVVLLMEIAQVLKNKLSDDLESPPFS